MDRITAIKAVAWNLSDAILDARPASLTGSSLQFAELIQTLPQQLQGIYSYVYGGAGAGQERIVGSFNPAQNEVVFPQVFGSIPSLNSDVLLTRYWNKAQYDNALNRFIGKARTSFLEDLVATTALVATQYEYTVPSGMEWVNTLRFVPSSGSDYADISDIRRVFELPARYWRIERNQGGSYTISIDPRTVNLDNFDGQIIRINGQAKPNITATDNATIPEDLEEYLISGTSMLLASQRIRENQEWRTKFYMFRDDFKPLEDYIFTHAHGKKVR